MSITPLISVGVPVYNDADWLQNALDHILGQTYTNLEVIIADDGSTDSSRDICREYASRDGRIRYFENKHNLGVWGNHRFVFDVSQGDYFAWGSGHDYWEPLYINTLLEQLYANPAVVMCCPKALNFKDGVASQPPGLLDTRGMAPREGIKSLMEFRLEGGSMDIFYGLYRSEFLEKVEVGRDVLSADEIMFAELLFMGELLQINIPLIHKVKSRGSKDVRANRATYREYLDSQKLSVGSVFKYYLPRLYSFAEYMRMVENAKIDLADKEWLFGEIKTLSAHYTASIFEELDHFIGHFKKEIPALIKYPLFQKMQAAQVLNILNFAMILGFEHGEADELRLRCRDLISLPSSPAEGKLRRFLKKIVQRK